MSLELQQIAAKKDKELAEKDAQIYELLQAYNAKLAKEYTKKSEKMPGAGEVFNEAENILDEHDKALLATSASLKKEKAKPKRQPLPAQLPQIEVLLTSKRMTKCVIAVKTPFTK